jgi:8-oxo-dGTP pyrophosphatase MutT (NUDIX family)
MFSPRILWKSHFAIAALAVELHSDEWTPPPDYEVMVNAAWNDLLARTTHPLWDGIYYRVLGVQDCDQGLLRLGTVRYRYIATFPGLHQHHACLNLEPLNHLSIIALIRCSDGFYLFGRRTGNGETDFIGGGVQKDELEIAAGADLERNLLKEIQEETGIRRDAIQQLTGIGILLSSTSNVLIAGHANTGLTKAQAIAGFAERTDDEMSDLVFIPKTELASALRSMSDYRQLISGLIGSIYR